MNKKRWILIVICVLIIGIIGGLAYKFSGNGNKDKTRGLCKTNSDCVPAECCHPKTCVVKEKAPDCDRIFCTQECEPGTMDCGQGSCECINENCEAVIK